jgi:hypothetical protein
MKGKDEYAWIANHRPCQRYLFSVYAPHELVYPGCQPGYLSRCSAAMHTALSLAYLVNIFLGGNESFLNELW